MTPTQQDPSFGAEGQQWSVKPICAKQCMSEAECACMDAASSGAVKAMTPTQPSQTEAARPAFEAWLSKNPNARFWNTTDAMLAAFIAGRAELDRPQGVAAVGDAADYPTLFDRTNDPTDVNTLLVPFRDMERILSSNRLSDEMQKFIDDFAFEAGKSAIAVLQGVCSHAPEGVILKHGFNRARAELEAAIASQRLPVALPGEKS